ncbi:MAG: hypothetical protein K0R30_2876 [Ornithinibacter sp.]|nr:hypothetical protein [Ornithinibacter sp.]
MVGPNTGAAEDFFAGSSLGLAVLVRVREVLAESHPDVTERVGRSQVAFRRRRGFAYLWMPGQYLKNPRAEVVLSLALPSRLDSPRFAEVVHPAPTTWMHHLDVHTTADVDDEVAAWLVHAADVAGPVAT